MFKTILKLTAIIVLCSLSHNSLAQKQTISLKSTAVSTDSSYTAICSGTTYLPTNIQRLSYINLIAQDKNKRLLFAQKGAPGSVSILDGNNWSYLENISRIMSFYSDKKMNTWVGVDSGAYVFNGITWKKYAAKTNQITAFTTISEDKQGNIWAFSGSLGFIADTVNQIFKQVTIPIDHEVTSATIDKDANMWVATVNGVYKYDGTKWTKYSTNQGLYQNNVRFINCLNDTIYTLSGMAGDSIQKYNGLKFTTIKAPAVVSYGNQYLTEDKDHNLWLLDASQNIYKYSENSWTQFNISTYCNIYWISAIFFDIEGNMWFGSQLGNIAKLSNGVGNVISNNLDKGIGFVNPTNPFLDKKNNVWVRPNSRTGASKFDGKKWTYFNNDTMNIWGNNWESSFAQDKEGNVYTGGLSIVKFDGNRWTWPDWSVKLGSYVNTSALMFDKNNHLWFTCYGGKIVKFDGVKPYEFSEEDSILNNNIPAKIVQDKDNNIWVIYFNGSKVSKYNGEKWTTINLSNASNFNCYDIVADSLGNIWFGTSSGLIKYNKSIGMKSYNTFNSKISSDFVYGLFVDKQNNLWITYNSNTITVFYNNIFHNFSLKEYGEFNSYGGIAVDDNKNVYLGSYGYGLLKISFSILAPEITKSDIACVGADNGVINILPKKDISYTYSINGSPFVKDTIYSNLKSGSYNVIGKKGQCYTNPKNVAITQPAGKFDVSKKDATCYGLTDGSISILTDGLGSVSYTWPTGKDTCALKNIGKGTYKVTVKYGSCQFDRSFDIAEPKQIVLTGNLLNACGNKGKIDISLTNGVEPYSIKWSNGDSTLNLKNLSAGNYKVSVKDANKCNTKDSTFTIQSFDPIPKSSIIGISKAYICSSNLSISTINDFKTYAWYKDNSLLSSSTKSILATETGNYKVAVVDQNNCIAFDSIKAIKRNTYAKPQICLVTVDETTNKNKIIWNKFAADSSVIINVLKETNQSGKYSNIGKIPAYNSGIFTDDNSDPTTLASRYKLNLTDECKIDSDTGTIHKTIHLTSNMGTHGEVNLIWSGYEGFTFDSYNIYRGTSQNNLTLLTTIQSNLNSYTDANAPVSDKLYYQLEVLSPSECNPNALKAGIISSKSNLINRNFTAVSAINSTEGLKVFPNPVEDVINVTFDNLNSETLKVKLCDITGKVIRLETTTKSSLTIERGNLKGGIYLIEIEGKTGTNRIKIIIK